MQRPRLTIRRLVIAVAVVGIVLGVALERRSRFARIAEGHRADLVALVARMTPRSVYDPTNLAIWHGLLRDKCERAARHPFLPVAPDPLEAK